MEDACHAQNMKEGIKVKSITENITKERVKKIKEIWNKMHGRLVPGFRWNNHPMTPYYYDEKHDSFNCLDVSICIDIPTEEITLPKLVYLIDDLEEKVYLHYRDQHNIDLGLLCYD